MPQFIEASLRGDGLRFDIIVSRFNSFITERLLDGALDTLKRHGAADSDLRVVRVPGSWEIPMAAQRLAKQGHAHAIICLGAVIQGSTDHHQYINAEVSKGIAGVSMATGIPIAFGILTTQSVEQAIERAGTKMGNKGAEAALAALEMALLLGEIDKAAPAKKRA